MKQVIFAGLLLVSGIALLAGAGYFYALERGQPPVDAADSGTLELDTSSIDYGSLPSGEAEVKVRIHNRSTTRTARIVHVGTGCKINCCYKPKAIDPVEIAPGQSLDYPYIIMFGPGPFEATVPVFVDDGGLRTLSLEIRGTGIEVAPHAPN
ncbi:MAG: hypothetical protein SNJ75_09590 [Gemmataceae bacterium]